MNIFHIFNRSNDRGTLFHEDQNYQIFLSKMHRQLAGSCHLLGYCIMPNHFHLLVIPKHPILEGYCKEGSIFETMPTRELSASIQALLMGYTKSYNKFYKIEGSRFRQHTHSTYHGQSLRKGLDYLHLNPVRAGLVDHPSEWGFSSYNEYTLPMLPQECLADTTLGNQILNNQLNPASFLLGGIFWGS